LVDLFEKTVRNLLLHSNVDSVSCKQLITGSWRRYDVHRSLWVWKHKLVTLMWNLGEEVELFSWERVSLKSM